MIKLVKCPNCSEGYSIDLVKYGGKNIKCKKCSNAFTVPVIEQAQGEFEVVDEIPAQALTSRMPLQSNPTSANMPASMLHRNKVASQKGSVNIALLQRKEISRESIRDAFLSIHGSLEHRMGPIVELQRQLQAGNDEIGLETEKLGWLKDVLARTLATDQKKAGENLTKGINWVLGGELHKEGDEEAYAFALSITGKPVQSSGPPPIKPTGFAAIAAFFDDGKQNIRQTKIETIKAAISEYDVRAKEIKSSKAGRNRELQQQIDSFMRNHKIRLDKALTFISTCAFAEAVNVLQEMLNDVPVTLLDEVLVALSQCVYSSGNPSNAARHIQDAICFGATAPIGMEEGYNDLWAKASAGLPPS